MNEPDYIIHTDGGARGNPGPSALGYVIADEVGTVLKKEGEFLGEGTNNEAEYKAPTAALKKLKSLIGKQKAKKARVMVVADSELLVRQLKGEYKVSEERIQELFLELWNLRTDFGEVSFEAVPREKNKEADRMVNEALDEATGPRPLFS